MRIEFSQVDVSFWVERNFCWVFERGPHKISSCYRHHREVQTFREAGAKIGKQISFLLTDHRYALLDFWPNKTQDQQPRPGAHVAASWID